MTTSERIEFNPLDPAFRVDPYPMYKRLLEEAPVYRTSFGLTVFSRYEDCREIFKDHKRFSVDPRKSPTFMAGMKQSREAAGLEAEQYQTSFLSMDPPDHTRLRRLVNLAFTPRAVEALRPRVEQLVDEMLDRVAEKGQMDIVADLAYPLPVAVICEMLGIPREDHEAFNGWSAELARSLDPEITVGPEALKRRAQAARESMDYFRELIERRRSEPRDDILSALIAAEEEGDKMSEEELISTCSLILVAGHETTVNLIANAVLQLLRHPDQLAKFVADPDLAQGVVEESLRFDPPVQFDRRFPLADTQVGGYPVSAGAFVLLLLGAANRDPAQFENPNEYDITRNDDRHISFGHGIHFCLGAPLARMEGQIALRTLTQRFKDLRLLTNSPQYKEQITLRGLESLPVAFDPRG